MKRLGIAFLILVLALSSCAPAAKQSPAPQPQMEYDPTPEKIHELTVNGEPLSGIYSDGEREYVRDLAMSVLPEGSLETEEGVFIPLDQSPLQSLHPFFDEEQNRFYYTSYPLAEEIPEGYEVPTLMYHCVADECWSSITELFVKPAELEKQIQWLLEEGYTPIHFEDLGSVDEIEKPILLTFDDGYLDNYTNLYPILKKYNVKATIFMIMGFVGNWNYLTAEQIQEMDASGLVSFQSHTMTHEFLSTRTEEQLQTELYQSKLELARLIGKESFVLCYPTGKYSENSLEATAEHYQFGLLMSGPTYQTGTNPLKITRKYIARSTTLDAFIGMVS